MKIQCNVCESAEATLLCCADEAALCCSCDVKVHAANKLASKHQRVPLSSASSQSQMPKCDICQDSVGYFFCLEDRALLCRNCDVSIHTVNNMVSVHQRFLLTGVKVGLEAAGLGQSSNSSPAAKSWSGEKSFKTLGLEACKRKSPISDVYDCNKVSGSRVGENPERYPADQPFSGGSSGGGMSNWMDDFYGLDDMGGNYPYMNDGSPKADSDSLGDSEKEIEADQRLSRIPDTSWMVPEHSSPTRVSGLEWVPVDSAAYVPDVRCEVSDYRSKFRRRL